MGNSSEKPASGSHQEHPHHHHHFHLHKHHSTRRVSLNPVNPIIERFIRVRKKSH
jgi:hypothetical protein